MFKWLRLSDPETAYPAEPSVDERLSALEKRLNAAIAAEVTARRAADAWAIKPYAEHDEQIKLQRDALAEAHKRIAALESLLARRAGQPDPRTELRALLESCRLTIDPPGSSKT